jgi:small subunit ribosomal protein S9
MKKKPQIITSGKRKRAIAKVIIIKGTGKVKINKQVMESFGTEISRMKVKEPLIIAGKLSETVDLKIFVKGGGIISQADAIRLAVAKALVEYSKDENLEKAFADYDRHLLVADVRQREPSKPNRHGQARAKKQKSYR